MKQGANRTGLFHMVDSKSATDLFLSCDWGTSSFRLKLADRNSGKVLNELHSSSGIKKVYDNWVKAGNSGQRLNYFLRYLEREIVELEDRAGVKLESVPVILSGMASSSIGMKELPYSPLPLSLKKPDLQQEWIRATTHFRHDLLLISGISSGEDLIRGEETQLIGLAAGCSIASGICILPGTHSKHIFIRDDQLIDFKTYMTGEIFDLLAAKSILSGSIELSADQYRPEIFKRGVREALTGEFLHSLFSIRANDILYDTDKSDNAEFLSGLVIGTELAALKQQKDTKSTDWYLIGDAGLQRRYDDALREIGVENVNIMKSEELVTRGHLTLLSESEV